MQETYPSWASDYPLWNNITTSRVDKICNNASTSQELLPVDPTQPEQAELAFQLLLVFLPPADLVAQLLPGHTESFTGSCSTLSGAGRTVSRCGLDRP
jgi:hypothetical protein